MILVTGGTGLIGSELVRQLLALGKRVRVLSRKTGSESAEWAVGDITRPETVREALRGVEVVFHLAALVDHMAASEELEKVNVAGTAIMVRAAAEAGVSRFVHCSTVSAEAGGGSTPYGISKILAEKALAENGARISWVVVRPGPVYAAERASLNKAVRFAARFRVVGKLVPDAFIHLASRTNVVDGLILAAYKGRRGSAYTLCDREPVRRSLLTEIICRKTRAFSVPLPLPLLAPPLHLGARIVAERARRRGVRPPVNPVYLKIFTRRRAYDIGPAVRDLGYRPASTADHFAASVEGCLSSLAK